MILSHFDEKDWEFSPDYSYLQTNFKPVGLWLSDESEYGWKSWCQDEGFRLDRLESETHFSFTDNANIFKITTREEAHEFDRNDYWQKVRFSKSYPRLIDWDKVASEYDGILISPYYRGILDVPLWYYGWDVPSACVWNLGAIQQIDPRLQEETAKALEELRNPAKDWDKKYEDLSKRVRQHQNTYINSSIDF